MFFTCVLRSSEDLPSCQTKRVAWGLVRPTDWDQVPSENFKSFGAFLAKIVISSGKIGKKQWLVELPLQIRNSKRHCSEPFLYTPVSPSKEGGKLALCPNLTELSDCDCEPWVVESCPGQLACHVANQKHVGKLCSPFLRCLAQLTAWLGICPFSHHYEHPPARLYHGVFVWPQFGLLQNLSKFSTWPFVCHFADPGFCRPVYAANNHDPWQLLFFSRSFLPEHGMCFVPKRSILDTKFDLKKAIFSSRVDFKRVIVICLQTRNVCSHVVMEFIAW